MAMNTWRQYGGIYANEKFQNIGVGTVVADKLLLRQQNINQSKINGTLIVTEGIDASGQITAQLGLVSLSDAYIKQKLFFGTTSVADTNPYYITGDSVNGYIGINTVSPTYALDVNSNNSMILALRSSSSTIQNILGENSSKNGITSTVTSSSASLGFFVGGNVEAGGPPMNTLSSTGKNLTVSSSGLQLNANVCISKTNITSTIFNENLTIYDNSINTYLYDVYGNAAVNTGSAMSLVASDGNANTFMQITTSNKIGGTINGGAFPGDSTRGMLTLGVTNPSFIPAQSIVSGKNTLFYRATTGFNTFSPKSENYVMDINGPTHIGNGELITVATTNFQITAMKFSKINPSIGFAVGTPTSQVNKFFTQYFASTTNGGQSWTLQPAGIPYTYLGGTFGESSEIMNIFVYDNNNVYVASRNNNYFYYSTNGGATFNYVNNADINKYNTLYANNNNNGNRVVYLGGTQTVSVMINNVPSLVVYQRLFYISDPANTSSNASYNLIPSIQINEMDGVGNYLYVAGRGIQKYDISNCPTIAPVAMYANAYNSSTTYNCIYAYSATYVVAGGNGVISYTTDGMTWSDVSLPQYNIKSVYVYDAMNAVAVGDAGVFLYTTTGATTWNPVPTAILNASGIANQIQGSSCNLSGIFMPNLNSFVISNVLSTYTSSAMGPILNYGKSKIMYGFFPALFNFKNNRVLDVCGNMGITGDILVNGNLVSTGAISAPTMNVNNIRFVQNQYGELDIYGNIRVNGILSSTTLYAPSYIGISVLGNTILSGTTTQTGNLSIVGTTTHTGNLSIVGTTTQTGNLSIVGTTTQTGNLSIVGTTTQTGNLSIKGTTTQTGNLSIVGATTQTGNLSVFGNLIVYGSVVYGGVADGGVVVDGGATSFIITEQGCVKQFDM
jgi:hypothetical protein